MVLVLQLLLLLLLLYLDVMGNLGVLLLELLLVALVAGVQPALNLLSFAENAIQFVQVALFLFFNNFVKLLFLVQHLVFYLLKLLGNQLVVELLLPVLLLPVLEGLLVLGILLHFSIVNGLAQILLDLLLVAQNLLVPVVVPVFGGLLKLLVQVCFEPDAPLLLILGFLGVLAHVGVEALHYLGLGALHCFLFLLELLKIILLLQLKKDCVEPLPDNNVLVMPGLGELFGKVWGLWVLK